MGLSSSRTLSWPWHLLRRGGSSRLFHLIEGRSTSRRTPRPPARVNFCPQRAWHFHQPSRPPNAFDPVVEPRETRSRARYSLRPFSICRPSLDAFGIATVSSSNLPPTSVDGADCGTHSRLLHAMFQRFPRDDREFNHRSTPARGGFDVRRSLDERDSAPNCGSRVKL